MTNWGHVITLHESPTVRFGVVTINVGCVYPWQCYTKSDLIYFVKCGQGDLTVSSQQSLMFVDCSYPVERGNWHEMDNTGEGPLILYFMQCGEIGSQAIGDT